MRNLFEKPWFEIISVERIDTITVSDMNNVTGETGEGDQGEFDD